MITCLFLYLFLTLVILIQPGSLWLLHNDNLVISVVQWKPSSLLSGWQFCQMFLLSHEHLFMWNLFSLKCSIARVRLFGFPFISRLSRLENDTNHFSGLIKLVCFTAEISPIILYNYFILDAFLTTPKRRVNISVKTYHQHRKTLSCIHNYYPYCSLGS